MKVVSAGGTKSNRCAFLWSCFEIGIDSRTENSKMMGA
jgi:hypothetical protein